MTCVAEPSSAGSSGAGPTPGLREHKLHVIALLQPVVKQGLVRASARRGLRSKLGGGEAKSGWRMSQQTSQIRKEERNGLEIEHTPTCTARTALLLLYPFTFVAKTCTSMTLEAVDVAEDLERC